MRVLLDECIDRRFAREIIGYEVKTVPQRLQQRLQLLRDDIASYLLSPIHFTGKVT